MMTVSDAFEAWSMDSMRDLKASTRKAYRSAWSWLHDRVGVLDVCEINQRTARQLVSIMRTEEASVSTMKIRVNVLRCAVRYASELGEAVAPTDWTVRYPHSIREEVHPFTEKEVRILLKEIEHRMTRDDFTLMGSLISLMTGMRIGEVCGLKWKDVELTGRDPHIRVCRQAHSIYLEGERVEIRELKTRSGYRTVPVLPQLGKALRKYGGEEPPANNYVVGNRATPMTTRGVSKSFRRFIYSLPVAKLNFHCLRHTYATMLVAASRDVTPVTKILGHSSTSVTMDLYVHPTEEYKRRTARRAFEGMASVSFDFKNERDGKKKDDP